jgi:hypothetical protein
LVTVSLKNVASTLTWLAFSSIGLAAHAQTVPEGPDHATQVLGNAWDMSAQDDVHPLLWTHNLSSATVSSGVMTGTARDTDPHFWLQFPRIPSAIQADNVAQPAIAATTYNKIAFMMWLPDTVVPGSRNGRLVWHAGGGTVQAFDAAYSESPMFPVYPGWHIYHFDLAALSPTTGSAWGGSIQGLRIDPCLGCQVQFKLDWARLYNDADTAAVASLPAGKTLILTEVLPTGSAEPVYTTLPAVQGGASVSRLPPAQYRVAPISDGDYALANRGKSWSFNTHSDTLWVANGGVASPQVGAQGLTGVTASPDPYILLDIPQHAPINASQYKHITVDLTVNQIPAQESGLLLWWGDQAATVRHPSSFVPLRAGRNTYQIDLSQSANWTGTVRALRIDPLNGPNAGSNVPFTLHSVKLTKTSGFTETVAFNAQPLTVNARPQVDIVSPAFGSGDDYALVEHGQPWALKTGQVKQPPLGNMAGWEYITQLSDLNLQGQFFHATSVPATAGQTEGDPHAFLAFQENTHPIDAQTYRWLGFDLYVPMDATQQSELTRGAVARVAWKATDTDPGLTTDDIVLLPGLQRYWFDMSKVVYEPATTRTWSGLVRYLRVDPFEFPESRHFYLGTVQLRSTPTARMVWPVVVKLTDTDVGDRMSVSVKSGATVLASATGLSSGTHQLIANLGALPAGEHYLTVEVSDGRSQIQRAAQVPVTKLAPQEPMPPHHVKAADRIFTWAEALLGPALGTGTPSASTHACFQFIPGAYGRSYTTGICLFTMDGLILYTTPASGLVLAGTTVQLLDQAAAAGH